MECKQITTDSYAGNNYYGTSGNDRLDFFKEVLYRDPKTSGFLMEYPHGIIIKQAERNHYYRGENQKYEKSISSLLRKLNNLPNNEKIIYEFIAHMRIGEFKNFLSEFDYVQNWGKCYGTVLYEALAQHYGLDTYWLDITNDFNTALFFATCRYDNIQNKWKPLTKEDTEKSEDTKFGYIFHIPAFQQRIGNILSCSACISENNSKINCVFPIGFQPFERCYMQHGYGIYMEKDNPLQKDITFEKLRFRHSERLSQDVFNLMEEGKKIYPHEEFNVFNDIIDIIKNTNTFSIKAFEYAKNKLNYFNTPEDLYEAILKIPHFIDKDVRVFTVPTYNLSRQRRRSFNRKFKGFSIEKAYNIKLMTRMSYTK